jgi:hypothetical protein
MPRLLNLGRVFLPASTGPDVERAQRVRSPLFSARTVSWSAILLKPCTVLLGEAGSGKTSELRGKADELGSAGHYSFFLPIESLAKKGVARSLDLEQARKLREWSDSKEHAVFLLDSLDESKLKGHSLSDALTSFAHELEQSVGRARVIISSRVSDWRSMDEEAVARLRPHLARPIDSEEEETNILELAPLNVEQVLLLARHHGLLEESRFLEEVRDANAWSFLERPLDVHWLVAYWNTHKRLGTLRELLEFNITERLKERPDRPTTLTLDRAREGARQLALVAQLTRSAAFLLPGEVPDLHATDAIDPRDILTSWTNADITDLLSRGLFDEATYGRVRIHHRNAQEFLAAEQLTTMVRAGLAREDLEALLFRESIGRTYVPSNLQAVVAWCSLVDGDVRRRAIEVMPEHLLDLGDPSGLPAPDRKVALLAYAERFRDYTHAFHYFDPFGLKRFACPELLSTLRELLEDHSLADASKLLPLQIVEHGKLVQLADAALDLALADASSVQVRLAAIDAGASAEPAQQRRLLGLLVKPAGRDRDVAARCIDLLFPANMTADEVLQWLRHVEPLPASTHTALEPFLASRLSPRCTQAQRRALLDALSSDVLAPAAGQQRDEEPTAIPERSWLGDVIAVLLKDCIGDPTAAPATIERAFDAITACENRHYTTSNHRLGEIIRKDMDVRRAFFWRQARIVHEESGCYPRVNWALKVRGWFDLGASDSDWLTNDVLARPPVWERLLAFNTLLHVTPRSPETMNEFWTKMEELARAADETHGDAALQKHLHRARSFSPPEHERPWRLQKRARERRAERERSDSHAALRAALPEIRSGASGGALMHLHESGYDDSPRSKRGDISCDAIAKRYDSEIASAARQGFKQYWRTASPVLIEEFTKQNEIPWICILGLAGLSLDVEDGLVMGVLPDDLMRRALAYAPWEMNGFPPWVEDCAEARPELVRDVFSPALRRDYDTVVEDGATWNPRLLGKLTDAPMPVRRACAPTLIELLRKADPPHLHTLRWTLQALGGLDAAEVVDGELTRQRAASADLARFSIWWTRWLSIAPFDAILRLEQVLPTLDSPDAFVEGLCDRLWDTYDEHERNGLASLRSSVQALARLLPIIRAHVRPEDDLHHKGGYSPVPRDHAQRFRDSLLSWLASTDGPEAARALDHLVAHTPPGHAERDWLRHLAATRALADVSKPMALGVATRFLRSSVLEPRSERELFAVALNRLRDIAHHVQHSDFSTRAIYNPQDKRIQEEPTQLFLASELENVSRKQYSVVRESEVADKNEPDIRLWNPECGGPVSVEVKVAERYTVLQLQAAIETQLVGKYMRASNSNYGILVLCSSGKPKAWEHGCASLTFDDLLQHLSEYARGVVARTPTVVDVAVKAIDFH